LIVECGGTVGDIESLPFLEALRQIRVEDGLKNVIFVHVTLAPSLDVVGEQKTKPTQHSVQELRRIGIQPDFLAVRCTQQLEEKTKKKIALFTNVASDDVLSCHDTKSIFEVPQILYNQGILDSIFTKFGKVGMVNASANWDEWNKIAKSMINHQDQKVKIAMVGKYVTLADSYVSVNHALKHAGGKLGKSVDIDWIDSESINDFNKLSNYVGILVPGGFGTRGSEGIIKTANYARERNIPYLGICFGFQLAAISFGRNVLNLEDANSTEIKQDAKNPVVDLLPEQKNVSDMGGSLRLGKHKIMIKPETMAQKIYGSNSISKRHRHRYEINTIYIPEFEKHGMIFSAESDKGKRMEMLEIPDHKFYLGVQFHPEFNSRPGFSEESFVSFVKAAAS
jgi:CTP synthase